MRWLAVALAVATSAPAWAEDVGFIEASSELDDGKPATNAYNAADGKDTTAWCAKKSDRSPFLSFGFDQPVTITHIGLIVGRLKGTALDTSTKRARVVILGDLKHRVEARFKDKAEMQTLELSPPAHGTRIVVDFPNSYDGATPDAPLCISELVLKHNNSTMTGASVAAGLRALNTPEKRLLHRWLDDPSAPQRTLTFNVDGTFTYRFDPLLEGKPSHFRGKWSATGHSVVFTLGDKSWRMSSRLTRLEGDTATVELTLEGDGPNPSMAATFRPAPKTLP